MKSKGNDSEILKVCCSGQFSTAPGTQTVYTFVLLTVSFPTLQTAIKMHSVPWDRAKLAINKEKPTLFKTDASNQQQHFHIGSNPPSQHLPYRTPLVTHSSTAWKSNLQ
jgi:hypothetical protein